MSSIDVSINAYDPSFGSAFLGITFDNSNNYYLSNNTTNISTVSSTGVIDVNWYSNVPGGNPQGLTYNSYSNSLYYGNNEFFMSRINVSTRQVSIASDIGGFIRTGAVGSYAQYIYYTNANASAIIYRLDASSSITTSYYTFGSAINTRSLTTDTSGNLYCLYFIGTNQYVNRLLIPSNVVDLSFNAGTYTANLGGGLAWFDNSVYVSNNTNISKYSAITGALITSSYINTTHIPRFLAFNNSFLYFTNAGTTRTVYKGVQPTCFNYDTKILCLNNLFQEEYIPIQDLKSGDLVKTYLHGYRKIDLIGKISFSNHTDLFNCMYKMEKTEENGLLEDLIITGGHSLMVDSISVEEQERYCEKGLNNFVEENKIDDKYLLLACVSDKFVKVTSNDVFTCYLLVPENNGDDNERFGIWANGILTETPCKNYFKTQDLILL